MIAHIELPGKKIKVNLSKPIDLSIPIHPGNENVNAFYIAPVTMEPFRAGGFVGDINQGGSCNVNTIVINPHGNGTHTETVGHITKEKYPIYKNITQFFFEARIITLLPEEKIGDRIITLDLLRKVSDQNWTEALIIRTLPNDASKCTRQYSGTNPPYMDADAALFLREAGVKHLLLDLPSIDREDDGGKLSAHHAFWNYPAAPRADCTISELIYVPDSAKDGYYLLNLQFASFDNDASPSKPVVFFIED
ncbi:MAG: cyclase family protein [Bacteroidetes bacterium]|nr:cyclase family protein [Bacteroidota bacterium]